MKNYDFVIAISEKLKKIGKILTEFPENFEKLERKFYE